MRRILTVLLTPVEKTELVFDFFAYGKEILQQVSAWFEWCVGC